MSFLEIIGTILIGPLKLLFEVIFSLALTVIKNPGISIIVLSLAMNILVLPLYRRADAIQIEARDTENKLKDVVSHIKKTFSGDERMMILQTYYRQNNYNPISVLSGSISLLLEIPFFMAAYQFLSKVSAFSGASFGPVSDLSVPDRLIVVGGFTINVLPIIMTLVNVISSSLYLKGFPLKTKIQLYGMALFFLIFLYNSPAALVFYWTLNNLFSLVKTIFYKIKNSKIILQFFLSALGIVSFVTGILMKGFFYRSIFMISVGVITQLPWMLPLLKKFPLLQKNTKEIKPKKTSFVCGGLFLTVLVGLFVPSTYISASVQEFIDPYYFYEPVWNIIYTLCISIGTFLVWFGVFYWLANPKVKVLFEHLVWSFSGIMILNYMFFGTKLGVLSPDLVYTDGLIFSTVEQLINIAVAVVLFIILFLLYKKFSKKLISVLLVGVIVLTAMSTVNISKTLNKTTDTKAQLENSSDAVPNFSMSTKEKNVVVIMLDRGIGPFVPYIMQENPSLKKQFEGFTYYKNTLSYGGFTNFATPSLYGGYDYTPININLKSNQTIPDKHNEALKVMPTIFSKADYNVSLIDPSYAGYQWISDLSIYKDISGIKAFLAEGRFNDPQTRLDVINARKRNFFLFSLMKTMPVSLQSLIYDKGEYRSVSDKNSLSNTSNVSSTFMNAYNLLKNLSNMTNVKNEDKGTYTFIRSNVTHEPVILQEPAFEPSSTVDNSAYYTNGCKTITDGEKTITLDNQHVISHYHVNMAALIQIGNWLDYLREKNIYDNTRIIIVSDHGRNLGLFDNDSKLMHNIEFYQPILLVKDFNQKEFNVSDKFMTNADVPALSVEGIIDNAVNPFTGNAITDSSGVSDKHYVIISDEWEISSNNGNQFIESEWATVSGDVSNKNNWIFYPKLSTLPQTK
jgi:YidC/Oxa1 family membrane protein insertase